MRLEELYRLAMRPIGAHVLWIGARTAARLRLVGGQQIRLLAGNRHVDVRVAIHGKPPEGTLTLSRAALTLLHLESDVARKFTYRIALQDGALRLGPVIGVLLGMSRERIPKNQHGYQIFDTLWPIRRLGGLVYYFTADDIDWEQGRIFGYVHFAERDNSLRPGEIAFETAWFPFPQAIYRRRSVTTELRNRMAQQITPYTFNTPKAANRLLQIEAVRMVDALKPHVPQTEVLTQSSLELMVKRYGEVYLKASGHGAGRSVHKVQACTKVGPLYRLTSRVSARSTEERQQYVNSYEHLLKALATDLGRPFNPGGWCVQQGIKAARWRRRPFDLRITVQKNGLGNWVVNGAYARVAPAPDSAVTRLGDYVDARELIVSLWPKRGKAIIRSVRRIGLMCARAFERRFSTIGDLGVDLVLNRSGKPWFLEANAGPGYRPTHPGDQDYWWQIIHPILYASYLSGFPIAVDRKSLLRPEPADTI